MLRICSNIYLLIYGGEHPFLCILIQHDEPDAGSSEAYRINVREMHEENPVTFKALEVTARAFYGISKE